MEKKIPELKMKRNKTEFVRIVKTIVSTEKT